MPSALHNPSFVHDDNLVAVPHRAQTVGDDDHRSAALPDSLHHLFFFHGIECAGGLVEYENHRFACQCRGYLYSLSLSARQVAATLDEPRVESLGPGDDVLAYAGIHAGHVHGEILDGVVPHLDILGDGIVEEDDMLVDDGHGVDKLLAADVLPFPSVKKQLPAPGFIQSRNQFRYGALAASRGAHDGHAPARFQGE